MRLQLIVDFGQFSATSLIVILTAAGYIQVSLEKFRLPRYKIHSLTVPYDRVPYRYAMFGGIQKAVNIGDSKFNLFAMSRVS